MSYLDYLPADVLIEELKLLRPSNYRALAIASVRINDFLADPEVRYLLFKYWSKDKRPIEVLRVYVPNLTLKQLEYVANYYYPVAQSGEYNEFDLMNNALLNGDTSLLKHSMGTYSPEVSAYVQGYTELALKGSNRFTYAIRSLGYDPALTSILGHRLGSVKMYLDVLYKIWENRPDSPESEPYLIIVDIINSIAYGSKSDMRYRSTQETSVIHYILNECKLPEVIEFCSKVGVEYIPEEDIDASIIDAAKAIGNNDSVGAIYHTGLIDKASENVKGSREYIRLRISLSQFDSKKYPTYNLMHDIESGHYVDALHKVNTIDRNITLTYYYYNYTSWTASPWANNTFINNTYMSAAAQTSGQLLLSMHPAIAQVCYDVDKLKIENTPDNYYALIQRWCPQLGEVPLKHINVPLVLSCYYEPTLMLGEWKGDISVLIHRHLEGGASDDRIKRFIYNLRNKDDTTKIDTTHEDLVNGYLLLFAYDRAPLIKTLRFVTQTAYVNRELVYSNTERRTLGQILLGELDKFDINLQLFFMIINHTILSADQKLQILSRANSLAGELLDGISGLVYNDYRCLAGNIFNQTASQDVIEDILQVFGYKYVGKVKSLIGVDSILERFKEGYIIDPLFPLGLLWRETNYFRRSDSYTNDLIELVSNSTVDDDGTLLLNASRYNDYLQGVTVGGIPQKQFASPYGYTLRNPFGTLPIN